MNTQLQKQFTEKDVNRMRSLITGDYNASTSTQVGYTKQQTERTEGETWTEDGKTWTIKNGIKMTVPKFDKYKHLTVLPLLCPKCNNPMHTNEINKKMYSLHSMCFTCVIDMETKMRANGTFLEYQQKIMQSSVQGYINELETVFKEFNDNPDETIVSEQGEVEKWVGDFDTSQLQKDLEEHINQLKETFNL